MILPTIAAVIADVLDLGPAHGIGGTTRLCEDLQTDSLDRQCIAVDCDMAFGIEIPDDHVAEWLTVADIAATVARLTEERVAA